MPARGLRVSAAARLGVGRRRRPLPGGRAAAAVGRRRRPPPLRQAARPPPRRGGHRLPNSCPPPNSSTVASYLIPHQPSQNTASQAHLPATTGGSTRGPQTAAPPAPARRRAADRTESAHTRGLVPRSRTPQTGRGTAPRRPTRRPTTAAPRASPRATSSTSHAAAARGPGAQPLERRADLALRPSPLPRPSPRVPQIDQRPVGRVPTQRSTPEAGANARSQRAF
jgi:hypothetical protein